MSLASMTGYARAAGATGAVGWTWEVRSVNGRSLDLRLRLPSGHDALEALVRTEAARRLKRGNVTISLNTAKTSLTSAFRVNRDVLNQVLALAAELANAPGVTNARAHGLLALPGVIERAEPEEAEDLVAARDVEIRAGLLVALDDLVAVRLAEGGRLAEVLVEHIDEIEALVAAAGALVVAQPAALRARLEAQVNSLVTAAPALSPERLAQEVALIIAKADVREELDRLTAHVAAARDLLAQGVEVGRKLDFLAQEFNREANTLCSKSADVQLTRIGLDLKATIDRLREQVQTVE
jgi:uncharacterized protein (TIGR00255 family)